MAANLSVNQICHLIFTKDPAIHSLNQHHEFYYALTFLLIEIATREFLSNFNCHLANPSRKLSHSYKIQF